ncbi:hypothetical protein, partial [Akkermansia sp.]|uniref:hypothetical protein n=1 Tax=Akkermansia sp. TaxID=1872421 RepID=UPI0025BA16E5
GNTPLFRMHDFLSQLLSSIMVDWTAFKAKKEERFLSKKEVRAIVDKHKLPAEFAGSAFRLLPLLF